MSMTDEPKSELALKKERLAMLEEAYDKLLTGAQTAELKMDGFSEKFHAPDMVRLEQLIASLKRDIARREGKPSGAVFF